jgi:hypothetical protein
MDGGTAVPRRQSVARRLLPSPAMVVAGCALLLAGTGAGAVASGLINGSQIRNGTITGAKLRNHTVTATKLAVGAVKAYPYDVELLDQGFYFTDAQSNAYGRVDRSGTFASNGNLSVTHPANGVYCVGVTGVTVTGTTAFASVTPDLSADATGAFLPGIGYVTTQVELASGAPNCPGQFEVVTFVAGTVPVNSVAARRPGALAVRPLAGVRRTALTLSGG